MVDKNISTMLIVVTVIVLLALFCIITLLILENYLDNDNDDHNKREAEVKDFEQDNNKK